MAMIDTQPVKGTATSIRGHARAHLAVRLVARGRTPLWLREFDACVLEQEELYIRKAGDEITAQLYNFVDKANAGSRCAPS